MRVAHPPGFLGLMPMPGARTSVHPRGGSAGPTLPLGPEKLSTKLGHFVILFLLFSTLLSFSPGAFAQTTVETQVDPQRGTTRDTFVLRLTVSGSGAQGAEQPRFDSDPNFSPRSVGTSINHEIVNGQHSLNIEYSYSLQLKKNLQPGRYQSPGGTVQIGDQSYAIPMKMIEIVAQSAASKNDSNDIDINQSVSNDTPYVGEQILYETRIRTVVDFTGGELTPTNLLGVWRESLGKQSQTQGRSGRVTEITEREVLFPTETGKITFPERLLRAEFRVPSSRGARSRGIWDPFFGDPFGVSGAYETVQKEYYAPPIAITPKPLPPPPVSGLAHIPVGTVKASFSVNKYTIDQGDSVALKIILEGDANLRPYELSDPEDGQRKPAGSSSLSNNFRVYKDAPTLDLRFDGQVLTFKKTFSMAMVALKSGSINLPRFRIVSFSPKSNSYVQYLTPETQIIVKPKSSGNQVIVSGSQNTPGESDTSHKLEVSNLASDLFPQALGQATYQSRSDISIFNLILFYALALMTGLLTRRILVTQLALRADPRELLRRRAFTKAKEHLASADQKLDELATILPNYLRERLRLDEASITPTRAYEILKETTKNEEVAREVVDFLATIERQRFGQKAGVSPNHDHIKTTIQTLLRKLEKALILVICIAIAATNSQAEDSQKQVEEGVQLLSLGNHYYELGEFQKAAAAYEEAIVRGTDNGYVYYNLANSYYRIGELGEAIFNYRRAIQQLPRDPSVLANLSLARQLAKDSLRDLNDNSITDPDQLLVLQRHLSRYEASLISLITFCLAVLGFALEPLIRRRLLRMLTSLLLLLSLLTGLPLFVTREGRTGKPTFAFTASSTGILPAVVVTKELSARSGDSKDFQVVFKLNEGAEIETLEIRGNWIQVLLPDGRKGWTEKEALRVLD